MTTAVEARPAPTAGAAATLPAMLLRHADTRAKAVALRVKRLGRWEEITWGELHVGSRSIFEAAGFAEVSHPTLRRVVMRIDF